jgi:hypothetical protein
MVPLYRTEVTGTPAQPVPGGELMVRSSVERRVGDRVVQPLPGDLGAAALLGQDRDRGGHVAADRIACHRDPAGVQSNRYGGFAVASANACAAPSSTGAAGVFDEGIGEVVMRTTLARAGGRRHQSRD